MIDAIIVKMGSSPHFLGGYTMRPYPVYRHWKLQNIMLFNIAKWHFYNCHWAYAIVMWIGLTLLAYAGTVCSLLMFVNGPNHPSAPPPQWFVRPIFKFVCRGYHRNRKSIYINKWKERILRQFALNSSVGNDTSLGI